MSENKCTSITPSWKFQDSFTGKYAVRNGGYRTKWSSVGIKSISNMSISFWLTINTISQYWRNLISLTNSNTYSRYNFDFSPVIWVTPGRTTITIQNRYNGFDGLSELLLETEKFITIVWNNKNVSLYVNGILDKQYNFPSPLIEAIPNAIFYIGDPWHPSAEGVLIRNFSIYNCSLSQDKILLIYKSQLTTQCKSITPTWKFQDSLNWYKIKQNGYSTNWDSVGIESNSNMSISFWLNINTIYLGNRNIFHLTNTGRDCCNYGDRVPSVWITPGGTSMNIKNSTSSNGNDGFDSPGLPTKSQIFITIIWSGTIVYVYVNGVLNSQYNFSSPLIAAEPNATFYIGDPWYNQNDGLLIKYFSIYNCCLSQANILSIYNSQLISRTSCEYQMSATELQCYKNNYPQDLTNMNDIQLENHWSTIGCNQRRNNQCSSQQANSGMYTYKGCYNDTSIRAIKSSQGNVSSIDQCAQIAESKNQNVFGVQNGRECRTGLNEQAAYQYGANFNKDSCPKLGGSGTNQVYIRSNPFPPPFSPVPYLTNPNFANKENFYNLLDEEERDENVKIIFKNMIMIIIIILLFIFISRMLKE